LIEQTKKYLLQMEDTEARFNTISTTLLGTMLHSRTI